MARKPRIEFDGATYHVIVRGNQRQKVFHSNGDFVHYLSLFRSYRESRGFKLFGYVLMSNHIHMVLQTGSIPLSKIMQGINQSYTMYYNRKYQKVGHLFQGRYKAILCDMDNYLATLVRYVHLNPVRAGLVKRPEDYLWSGHRSYLKKSGNSLLDEDALLRLFSEHKGSARRLYRKFVDMAIGEGSDPEYYGGTDYRLLGDELFRDEVMSRLDESVEEYSMMKRERIEDIALVVSQEMKVSIGDIKGRCESRPISLARAVLMVAAVESGHKGKDIAAYLMRDPATVSRRLKDSTLVRQYVDQVLREG